MRWSRSNHAIRFEDTGNMLIDFDLNCRMTDLEPLLQLVGEAHQKFNHRDGRPGITQ